MRAASVDARHDPNPIFLRGWRINSNCTLLKRRKGTGMRWDPDNAESIMGLEALQQSDQWDLYWQTTRRTCAGELLGMPNATKPIAVPFTVPPSAN